MPQQYSSQNQMSPPGLAAREKEIIAKYSAQIRSMLLVVVVAILVGAGVAYGLKGSQTTLGLRGQSLPLSQLQNLVDEIPAGTQ